MKVMRGSTEGGAYGASPEMYLRRRKQYGGFKGHQVKGINGDCLTTSGLDRQRYSRGEHRLLTRTRAGTAIQVNAKRLASISGCG